MRLLQGAMLALCGVAAPVAVHAQGFRAAVGGSALTIRLRREGASGPGVTDALSGAAAGAEGRLVVGRWRLGVSYLQGRLDPQGGSATARDVVEGTALLGFRPAGWLTLRAGLRARAYALTGGTQRWLFWTVGARAERPFVGSAVNGYVELWRAVSADVNVPQPFDHAQGGEVGMVARLARAPLQARLAYRIDHAVLGAGSDRQTVDGLVVTVLLGPR